MPLNSVALPGRYGDSPFEGVAKNAGKRLQAGEGFPRSGELKAAIALINCSSRWLIELWPGRCFRSKSGAVIDSLASALFPITDPGLAFAGDPEYDPRLVQALNVASQNLGIQLPDIECISQIQNSDPDHESDQTRLYPHDRANTYQLHADKIPQNTTSVVLVDDMLTTGSQYKGAEIVIKNAVPHAQVSGLFVSRRVHENPFEDLGDIDISDFL